MPEYSDHMVKKYNRSNDCSDFLCFQSCVISQCKTVAVALSLSHSKEYLLTNLSRLRAVLLFHKQFDKNISVCN